MPFHVGGCLGAPVVSMTKYPHLFIDVVTLSTTDTTWQPSGYLLFPSFIQKIVPRLFSDVNNSKITLRDLLLIKGHTMRRQKYNFF